MSNGRLIAFEGVDGAGKTTALRHVAERLRHSGVRVFLPRIGKDHSSRPTRMIRQLTRDARNLELSARSELLLYCAREAQVLSELVRPALLDGQTVLVDRCLLTPVVLGMARGLPRAECEAAAQLASNGLHPDLTLVFDVHPRTSRLRKRLERIRSREQSDGGRKGLAGSAFKERVRQGYVEIARQAGYPTFHVERATPEALAARVVNVVLHGPGAGTGESELDATPRWLVPDDWTLMQALQALPEADALYFGDGLLAARSLRARAATSEPRVAAYTLDPEDPLREQLAQVEPDHALRGWQGRPLSGADDLRLRLLEQAPAAAIQALRYVDGVDADRARARYAGSEPDAVLGSLAGRDDAFAWQLRQTCWEDARDDARALSLVGCSGGPAWSLREALLERNPVAALTSLRGVDHATGNAWLTRYAEHAPKVVLAALAGRSDPFSYALRDALFETGREVIDTVRRLSDEAAFALRERALAQHPSTVAHSLLGLPPSDRVRELYRSCRARAAGDIHVHRRLALLDEQALAPTWKQDRTRTPTREARA